MKHTANIITAGRVASAILMLFTQPLSLPFFGLYTVGGVSDMIDGTIARRLGTAGKFGARLDSVADLLFLMSAAYKLLPALRDSLPVYTLWAVCAISGIKIITWVAGTVKFRRLCFLHTYMNKLTGTLAFLLPYFFRSGVFAALVYTVCIIALLAAIEEFVCVVKMKKYNAETTGFFKFFI
ncbi:MAG: CDP-alcohol phosphatidyltransferase family protein [Clostridiales bacterium]|nr:CDP-alcohol phosphatidyltransferase family protein [Clostridiales bacterium]